MLNLNCIGKSHIYFKAHRYFKISVHKKPLTIDPPLLKHILSRSATSNQGCGSCWILHGSGSYLIEKTGSDYDHREKNGAGSKPRKTTRIWILPNFDLMYNRYKSQND